MNQLEEARRDIDEIDEKMAELFVRRLEASARVLEYKRENSMPVFDPAREEQVIERGMGRMENGRFTEYYRRFIITLMDISKEYQHRRLEEHRNI